MSAQLRNSPCQRSLMAAATCQRQTRTQGGAWAVTAALWLMLAGPALAYYSGATEDVPGPEIARLTTSADGGRIGISIRSWGRNVFLIDVDGKVLAASRVDAFLPQLVCGADGSSLIARGGDGVAWQLAADRNDANPGASALCWAPSPQAYAEAGNASTDLSAWPGERTIDLWQGQGRWLYDDWAGGQSIEDYQHPRTLRRCIVAPRGRYVAARWLGTYSFRRQETLRAGSVMLLDGPSGEVLWDRGDLDAVLAVSGDGLVLCLANGRPMAVGADGKAVEVPGLPGAPLAAWGLSGSRFLVRCRTANGPVAVWTDVKGGRIVPLPHCDLTSAACVGGACVYGTLGGAIVAVSAQGECREIAAAGGPVSVLGAPQAGFLAATTAAVMRFDAEGRRIWRTELLPHVGGEVSVPRPEATPQLLPGHVAPADEDLGLLPDEGPLAIELRGGVCTLPLSPGRFTQAVIWWRGELGAELRLPGGGSPAQWHWSAARGTVQQGAVLLPPAGEEGEAELVLSGAEVERVELRTWRASGPNLGQVAVALPDRLGAGEPLEATLNLFNPCYYQEFMGTRPDKCNRKWRPAPVRAGLLGDGDALRRVMDADQTPWWYEVHFPAPRTLHALVALEDVNAPGSWATEGFASGLPVDSDEWIVLGRFRGRAGGRALTWEPVRLSALRFHVTHGGNACSEVMLYRPEDAVDIDLSPGDDEEEVPWGDL